MADNRAGNKRAGFVAVTAASLETLVMLDIGYQHRFLFLSDGEREVFLAGLGEVLERFELGLVAYTLLGLRAASIVYTRAVVFRRNAGSRPDFAAAVPHA